MSPVRCVVFDVDDTLYLERDYVRSGFAAVSEEVYRLFGVEGFSSTAWALFCEGHRGRIFDDAAARLELSLDANTVRRLVEVYRSHVPEICLLPDARAAILELRARGILLAAITDGPAESQRQKVNVLGLSQWMEPIVLTELLGAGFGKPHVAAFEMVCQSTGVTGDSCCYVADNPNKDFIAPRKLGWRTIRVRRKLGLHEHSDTTSDAELEIPTLETLLPLLA